MSDDNDIREFLKKLNQEGEKTDSNKIPDVLEGYAEESLQFIEIKNLMNNWGVKSATPDLTAPDLEEDE